MKTISLYNLKGGVGKTTLAVNLAYLYAIKGYKTVIWDLDPQGSATYYFQREVSEQQKAGRWLKGKESPVDFIIDTGFKNLSIIPSGPSMRHLEEKIVKYDEKQGWLKSSLKDFKVNFDIVILDCPPGLTRLYENIFIASDLIVIPVIPTPLSFISLEHLFNYQPKDKKYNKYSIVFSMVDARKKLHNEYIKLIRSYSKNVCQEYIPYLSEIEKIGLTFAPVAATSPNGRASKHFEKIWKEILTF